MTTLTPKQAAAFWERVDQSRGPDACWPWLGKTVDGYGRYALLTSHRVTYEAMVGPIPEGMTLDHVCHTKDATCPGGQACQHRRCVNPAHLEPVTSVENVMRGGSGPARNARKTHCIKGHPYDAENSYVDPAGRRGCRACHRDRAKRKTEALQENKALRRQVDGLREALEELTSTLEGITFHVSVLGMRIEKDDSMRLAAAHDKARAALAPTVAASEEEWTDEGDPGPFAEGITPSPATEAER